MARGRMLSKSLSTSRRFAELASRLGKLGEFGQALYPLMVAHGDDFGRLQGDPFTVKHQCHPTSPRREEDFHTALTALAAVDLIRWYEVEGRRYVEIVDFDRHQTGLHKRTKSRLPDPPGLSRKFPEIPGQEKRTEQKEYMGDQESPAPPVSAGEVGKPNGSAARFDQEFETAIRPIYPRRDGDQRWVKARSHYRAARKAGEPAEPIIEGVRRYAAWCERKGLLGTDKVKQAGTFFGPEKSWREPWATAAAGNGFQG